MSCCWIAYRLTHLIVSLSSPVSSTGTLSQQQFSSSSYLDVVPQEVVYALLNATNAQALSGWNATLPFAADRVVHIGWRGDSVSAGDFASNLYPDSSGTGFVQLLQYQLQSVYGFGDGGSGFQALTSANFTLTGTTCYSIYGGNPVVQNGGFGISTGSGFPVYVQSVAVGSVLSSYIRGIVTEVYYFTGPSYGSFQVLIDGVYFQTISTAGTVSEAMTAAYVVTPGAHNVTLVTTTNSVVWIIGVGGYNRNGVVIDNYSTPGLSLLNYNGFDAQQKAINPYPDSGGIYPHPADLMVYALGLNDAADSPGVFLTLYQQMIESDISNGITNFLFVLPTAPLGGGYDTAIYESYRPGLATLAYQYNASFADLNNVQNRTFIELAALGFYPDNNGILDYQCGIPGPSDYNVSTCNVIHPSDIGHALMAHVLDGFLLGCSDPINQTGCAVPRSSTPSAWTLSSVPAPVAWVPLKGNLYDISGNGNTLSLTGNTTGFAFVNTSRGIAWGQTTVNPGGLVFQSLVYPQNFSICEWVYFIPVNSQGNVIWGTVIDNFVANSDYTSPVSHGTYLAVAFSYAFDEIIEMPEGAGSYPAASKVPFPVAQWFFYCNAFNSTTLFSTINGTLSLSVAVTSTQASMWDAAVRLPIAIGADNVGGAAGGTQGLNLYGYEQHVMVFNYSLSITQMQDVMQYTQ